jgi:hypothetical protein
MNMVMLQVNQNILNRLNDQKIKITIIFPLFKKQEIINIKNQIMKKIQT